MKQQKLAGFHRRFSGNDLLVGGGGADVFGFANNHGNNRIKDFDATNDLEDIDLSGVSSITGFDDLGDASVMGQGGNELVINDGAGTVITLLNLQLGDLAADGFIF